MALEYLHRISNTMELEYLHRISNTMALAQNKHTMALWHTRIPAQNKQHYGT